MKILEIKYTVSKKCIKKHSHLLEAGLGRDIDIDIFVKIIKNNYYYYHNNRIKKNIRCNKKKKRSHSRHINYQALSEMTLL